MFLREIKLKDKTYLAIIETYREKGKVKQRCIGSLGCLDKINPAQLQNMAQSLIKYCKKEERRLFDISTTQEETRKKWGCVRVYKKLWDRFELDDIFLKITQDRKIEFDYFSAIFLMVLDRLVEPKSKLKSYHTQDKYYGIKENELHHLYRALDILAEYKEEMEKNLFFKNVNLFNLEVDVVLYDVTTLYFESVGEDELRRFGFSKEMKVNEVQIVLGLLIDLEGRPIGFDIFHGNTFEGHTLEKALEKIKKRFGIRKVIFVADRIMLSKDNLEIIKGTNDEYIIGCKIKSKSKKIKEEILAEEGYERVRIKEDGEEEIFKYKEIKLNGERLICTWSSKGAEKDRKDRERLISLAEEMLESGESKIFSKRGARKYIKNTSKLEPTLDLEKIKEEAKWDGYYGLQTNCQEEEVSWEKVWEFYKSLWKIEDCFRIFKSHLETRPIFHWTPKRIKGHMVLCFIAFLLERTLELEIKKNNIIGTSPIKIRESLDELEFSEVTIEGKRFFIRSKVEGLAYEILRMLKIKIPSQITTPESF